MRNIKELKAAPGSPGYETLRIITKIFGKQVTAYPMDGSKLKKYRQMLGASRKEFAELCHWSRQFQRQIESSRGLMSAVREAVHDRIVDTFRILFNEKIENERE